MTTFIGVDWGTTNLRAWRLSDHKIEDAIELPLGVRTVSAFKIPTLFEREVRRPLGAALPVLMCGMVGSSLGWRTVDYVSCPADTSALARAVVPVPQASDIRIVPGLQCAGITKAGDVMRGEETQIAGWIANAPAHGRGRHLICLPGTHSKWAIVHEGAVERFVTAMTGELFQVLNTHSILKSNPDPFDDPAFSEGVEASGDGDALSLKLFSARARVVAGRAGDKSASYLSGLLIGAEIGAVRKALQADTSESVVVIGTAVLRERYLRALSMRGCVAQGFDGADAAIAGLTIFVAEGALQ